MGVLLRYAGLAVIIVACCLAVIHQELLRDIVLVIAGLLTIFVFNFFRDPRRTPPERENIVISPADGKIVLIKDLVESEFLKSEAVQVSIFMSPLNVHVNRFPISGIVKYFRYIPGDYTVAFEEKSSERNERTHIGVEGNGYKVLFKQIAGAVARRIVAEVTVGQKVILGERFGMIKFGSRVDVIMPKKSQVNVRLGEKVRAGETILAIYSSDLT